MDTNSHQNQAESGDPPDGGHATSISDTFDLLSNRYRRYVLEYLHERGQDVVPIDDLVERVLEREARSAGRGPTRRDVTVGLHHTHLPKLDDEGLVDYDHEEGVVDYYPDPTVEYLVGVTKDLDADDSASR